MIEFVILLVLSLALWAAAIICMKGCNRMLISGYAMLPKEEREKLKEQYDIIAMNKYIGKTIFLPLAVVFMIIVVMICLEAAWMQSPWFGALIAIAAFAVLARCAYSAIQIFGDRFKKLQ